jgi:hypothetical protein
MRERVGVLDSYYLGEALKGSAQKLGERCGRAAIGMLSKRYAECAGAPEEDKHSYIWRSAIEDHEQNADKDSFRTVLVDALRDAALGIANEPSEEARESIKSLLQSPYPTLVRIGIYACGERYGNVGTVFWECFRPEWFVDIPYWHELFWFIKKAFARFSAAERARFLSSVEEAGGDWKDESRREELDESHRRDLLYPAVGLGDAEIDAKYQNLVERRGPVREHPDLHMYSTSGWVGERSPVTSEELVRMSDKELLALMRSFVPDSKAWDGPTYRGFASSLTAAVRASDDGFATRIPMFLDMPKPYQHGLLRGLKERWADDKRDIDWVAALSLMWSIVQEDAFQTDLNAVDVAGWEPSVHWVVTDISDLIKAGSSSTDRSMGSDVYAKSVEILHLMLLVTKPTEADEPKDAVSHAINSPRGRALEALINVALAMRRHEVERQQDSGHAWAMVAPILNRELGMSEFGRNADFAALAGMYCSNLHYLNARWVEDNFDRLFSKSSESAWNCAAQGFAYQRHLYAWLFERLIEGDHLRRMVFADDLSDSVAEKALQFLGLAYLEGLEKLEQGGLLSELVAAVKTKELSQLCWFFWTLRGSQERSASRVPLILEFWKQVSIAIRESGTTQPELQSALNLLAVFIDEVTPEVKQMWMEVAPYAQVSYHGYILVEHLARLATTYPEAVVTVFRAALSGFLPDHQREDVIQCVTRLAEIGRIEDAEGLCNAYAAKGSMLLKDTYEALRTSQRSRVATGTDSGGQG